MESARLATGNDLVQVTALAAEVSDELRPHRGGGIFFIREGYPGSAASVIAAAFEDDAVIVVVGEFAGAVLGYGIAGVEELADGTLIGRLDALAVISEARGVGVGEAMMNLLMDRLRSEGCLSVDTYALPGDRHTKNFFESFGLKARLLTVNKLL